LQVVRNEMMAACDGVAEILRSVNQRHVLDEIANLLHEWTAPVVVIHHTEGVVDLVEPELFPHVHDEILAVANALHLEGIDEEHLALVEAIEVHLVVVEIDEHALARTDEALLAEELYQCGCGRIESGTREIVEQELIDVAVESEDDSHARTPQHIVGNACLLGLGKHETEDIVDVVTVEVGSRNGGEIACANEHVHPLVLLFQNRFRQECFLEIGCQGNNWAHLIYFIGIRLWLCWCIDTKRKSIRTNTDGQTFMIDC